MTAGRKTLEIVPSLLAADLSRMGELVAQVRSAGMRWISVDVMDGHFVPNLSFGPDHVRMVKALGVPVVDAHLMVDNPGRAVPWFIDAGADFVTIHAESCADPGPVLAAIRKSGAKAGLAVKPATAASALTPWLASIDLALIMTVEPGFGGARFLSGMLPKIKAVRQAIDAGGHDCWLQVDGGINSETIVAAAQAGADSLVAGSAVFGASDPASAFKGLREKISV
ncbi:MAG: ribulose-phosphate 3-epimerase [Elusimicrobia bacterium]|nr:ribulose-phosphate 3-epimerase [Elusimicrobiota bacterium]